MACLWICAVLSIDDHWSGRDLRGTEAGESSLRRWPCHWCQGKASSWPWVAALSLLKERLGPDEGYLSASAHITTYSLVLWLFHHRHVPFNHVQSCSIMFNYCISHIYISCIVLYRLKSCYIYIIIYICLRQVRCDVSLSIPHLKAAGMPPSRPQGDRSHSCAACRSRQFTFSMLDKSWKMRQGHAGPMLATGDGCLKMLDAWKWLESSGTNYLQWMDMMNMQMYLAGGVPQIYKRY